MDAIFCCIFYDLQFSATDSRLLKDVLGLCIGIFSASVIKQKSIKNKANVINMNGSNYWTLSCSSTENF